MATIHSTAIIEAGAQLGESVSVDAYTIIRANVRIDEGTSIGAHCVIEGHTTIGAHCQIGGAAMILGHITLADHVIVSMGSAATRSILKPGQYTGVFPIDDNSAWEKNAATLRQLHALRERVRALEKKTP